MMRMSAKPIRSMGVKIAPVHMTAVTVAATGSIVPNIVARIDPMRTTPAI